ncbi:hypothetical protein GQ600_12609 [Phytophthora cactorum]|nr:hypothetical protein GQ600_12609 [Phytophthora cactorum]
MFKKLPLGEKIKKVVKGVVDFTLDTAIHLAQTIADAIEWIINTIRDPLVASSRSPASSRSLARTSSPYGIDEGGSEGDG